VTSDAPARRLLAGLVDEQALETEPIAEVRADLAALGLDPARAIGLARRLAAGGSSPALALLGKIAEADEDDDEIRRLERADIATIRQDLPTGTAASAIAHAQRAAAHDTKVVPLAPRRRPRRLLYGLGGVAAALAASVVLYVGLSTVQPRQNARDKTPALNTTLAHAPTNETDSRIAPGTPPADEPYGAAADSQAAPAQPADVRRADSGQLAKSEGGASGTAGGSTPPQPAAAAPAQELADAEAAARAKANQQQLARDLQSLNQPAASGTQTSSLSAPAEQISADELRAAVRSKDASVLFGLPQPVTDLLIVNPHLMPPDVRQEDYSVGDLPARLDEARKAAGGRSIVALVTVRGADRSHDAIIVVKPFEIDFDAGEQKVQEQIVRAIRARRAYQTIALDDR